MQFDLWGPNIFLLQIFSSNWQRKTYKVAASQIKFLQLTLYWTFMSIYFDMMLLGTSQKGIEKVASRMWHWCVGGDWELRWFHKWFGPSPPPGLAIPPPTKVITEITSTSRLGQSALAANNGHKKRCCIDKLRDTAQILISWWNARMPKVEN